MKWLFLFSIPVVLLSANCNREAAVTTIPNDDNGQNEQITYYPTDRNDIPPPPLGWHDNIDTAAFNDCQKRVWKYIGQFYPTRQENELNVEIYTLQEEGEDFMSRVEFHSHFTFFFKDTLTKQLLWGKHPPCYGQLDTTFFLQNLGSPTFSSRAPTSRFGGEPTVTYFYYIKNRDRSGPCPYFFDSDGLVNSRDAQHYMYCCMLKLTFRRNEGLLAEALYSGI